MKHFVRRHRRKLAPGVLVFALLATSAVTFNSGTTTLFFMPVSGTSIAVGETAVLDINISTETPINALGATVTFPPDRLQIVAINKEKTFIDLWTEETAIQEGAGRLRFSGGTFRTGGFAGTGTMLSITVKALQSGEARITFSDAEVYSHDGRGLLVDRELKSVQLAIAQSAPSAPVAPSQVQNTQNSASGPSPDFNGDTRVTLIDVSILTYNLFRPYNPRYDLDVDGKIGLSDLSILFSKII